MSMSRRPLSRCARMICRAVSWAWWSPRVSPRHDWSLFWCIKAHHLPCAHNCCRTTYNQKLYWPTRTLMRLPSLESSVPIAVVLHCCCLLVRGFMASKASCDVHISVVCGLWWMFHSTSLINPFSAQFLPLCVEANHGLYSQDDVAASNPTLKRKRHEQKVSRLDSYGCKTSLNSSVLFT